MDGFFYMVGYADYPPDIVNGSDVQLMLSGARDGAVANSGGVLLSERQIKFQGFPGREIWVEIAVDDEAGLVQSRLILVGNRLYQVLVGGYKEDFADANAAKALESFKVVW